MEAHALEHAGPNASSQCFVVQLARELEQESEMTEGDMTAGDITPNQRQSPQSTVTHRVAFVGARGVGKSLLIDQIAQRMRAEGEHDQLDASSSSSSSPQSAYREVEAPVPTLSFPSGKRVIKMVDTPPVGAPKEDQGCQLPLQIKIYLNGKVDAIAVCVDLTNSCAFAETQQLYEFWKHHGFAVALVGTKYDSKDEQFMQELIAWQNATQCPMFLTSAKDGFGIDSVSKQTAAVVCTTHKSVGQSPSKAIESRTSTISNSSVPLPLVDDQDEGCSCKACTIQ